MTKKEYLEALNTELERLNIEDRADAINYYSEYFDEAGEENIKQVISELGSPEELAQKFLPESREGISGEQAPRKRSILFYSAIGLSVIAFLIILTIAVNYITGSVKHVKTDVKVNSENASVEKQKLYKYANEDLPAFKNISVNVSNANVEIEPSTDGKYGIELALVIYEDEFVTHDVQDVSTLLVQIEEPHNSRSVSEDFSKVTQYVKITIPEDAYENFVLLSSNGEITIDLANGSLKKLAVTTSNDEIELKNATCPDISLTTSNGAIVLEHVEGDVIHALTSNDTIQLLHSSLETSAELITSNDDVEIVLNGAVSDFTIDAGTSNGNIYIDDTKYDTSAIMKGGSKSLIISTSNSDIHISFQ